MPQPLSCRFFNRGRRASAVTYSVVLSLVLTVVGVVLWIEGGPTPRTWTAWLLLVAILIVSALPTLLCWLVLPRQCRLGGHVLSNVSCRVSPACTAPTGAVKISDDCG